MLSLDPGLSVTIYLYVQPHRVAADRAVLDVVLACSSCDIHGDDDFFAA